MEPRTKKTAGRELGNAAAAAALCVGRDGKPITWESYQWYVRAKAAAPNNAPGHVAVDKDTGERLYPLKEVRAWQASRPGRGNWNGDGARARTGEPASVRGACPVCHRRYGVRVNGTVLVHKPSPAIPEHATLTRCPGSGQGAVVDTAQQGERVEA